MPPSAYGPLSQEDDQEDVDAASITRASGHGLLPRPPVYYGEGPFDPPSSDDESEELLSKPEAGSDGLAERGQIMANEVGSSGLYVGRRRVRELLLIGVSMLFNLWSRRNGRLCDGWYFLWSGWCPSQLSLVFLLVFRTKRRNTLLEVMSR